MVAVISGYLQGAEEASCGTEGGSRGGEGLIIWSVFSIYKKLRNRG